MTLTRAELWHWQGLPHVVLEDFSPRLNVILAPNESGKSRVFRAIRFALFESHRGAAAHKKALQGWGRPEAPRVEVRFEKEGVPYRVEKQFLKAAYAILEGGGVTLRDLEAENRLSELMGLDGAQAKRAGADQLGLWPLLWVEQFVSSQAPHEHLNEASRARLQDLLSAEIGEIAAGPLGEQVIRQAREEAGRFWTAASWRETGDLRKARETVEAAESALAVARGVKAKLSAVSDRLAEVAKEMSGLESRLEVRQRALALAQERDRNAREALSRVQAQAAAVEVARSRRESVERDLSLGREREQALAERLREMSQARGELAEGARAVSERTRALEETKERAASVEKDVASAQAELRRASRQAARTAAAERTRELEGRFNRVKQLRAALKELAEGLAGISVTREAFLALQEASAAWERAKARLEGASAQVSVRARRDLETPEGVIPAGGERSWLCSEPRTLTLTGIADLLVIPGGEGLPRLQSEERDLKDRCEGLLTAIGAASLPEAASLLEERQRREERAKAANAELKRVCPEGESVLEAAWAKARKTWEELGPEDLGAPSVPEAEAALENFSGLFQEARSERDGIAEALGRLREAAAGQESRVANLGAEAKRLEDLLANMPRREAVEEAAGRATKEWEEALGLERELRRRYTEAGGEQAAADAERERAAWNQLDDRRRQLDGERLDLNGQLKAFRGDAVHEREQEAETTFRDAQRRFVEVERRAAAARRLLEELEATRRSVQERLTSPVVERIQPYLEQLFPGSRLSLSERWEVVGLATGDTPEPFEELSGGAREQLGVLVRLGLGEVFAGEGRLPLILDDALVHSDPARLAAMHRVLFEASRRLQVIVFSCHEEAFDGLGAERRYGLPRGRALP